jgi:hypothetical protein
MKFPPLFAFLLSAVAVAPLSISAQDKANTVTISGYGASLAAPDSAAKVYDYVLTVGAGPNNEKHSFRIVCGETKILDPQGKPVTDKTCGNVAQALNQSVKVIYVKGDREPFRAISVQCLEQ